jgi:DNA repair exonuclease SbcCD ATPase subunit
MKCKKYIALLLSLCLFGPSFPALSYSQSAGNQSGAVNSSESIEQTAKNLSESATSLRERLESRKIQVEAQVIYWQNIAEALRQEKLKDKQESKDLLDKLDKAESELSRLRAELTEISRLLDESKSIQGELKIGFENYKKESDAKIKRLDRKVKALTVIKWVLAFGAASGWTAWAVK